MYAHAGISKRDQGEHREQQDRARTCSTNGAAHHQQDKVRVAIIGVGNCACSLVQGVHYYRDADPAERVPGLMHVDLGGYHVRDIEFSAAFDIDAEKVGKDLGEGDLVRPEQHDPLRRGAGASSAFPSIAA